MAQVRVQEAASYRLDEIYRYTRDRWGVEQADRYINGLFDAFEGIDAHEVASRPIPADFGVEGFIDLLRDVQAFDLARLGPGPLKRKAP